MKHIINIVILLLLSATAVLSCDARLMELPPTADDDGGYYQPEPDGTASYSLVISGMAIDVRDSRCLEEIKITVTALEQTGEDSTKEHTVITYTDNSGLYSMKMEGFENPVSCTVTAEDPNGLYGPGTHEIPSIEWDSDYNMQDHIFFVNNCDFYLSKTE